MKKIGIFIWLFNLALQAQVNNYQVGDIVDDFTVTDIDGNQYSLHQLTSQGKFVYIDFFYTSCSACQNIIPVINEFWDKYGCGANEIFCLAINRGYDDNSDVLNFENQYGGSFHHCPAISSEGGAANVVNAFGVNVFPTVCLIAPDNKLLNNNIYPIEYVRDLENTFPSNFNPQPASCSSSVYETEIKIPDIKITADREIIIELNKPHSSQVKIFDITGKLILNQKFNRERIIINHLHIKGTYILQITYGNSTAFNKIIVL
jgi:thiol-disulfide isomerase/thioredoxin